MIVADGALSGQVAVVTGASSGIGLATANRLHDLGASVTALARRRDTMQEGVGKGVHPVEVMTRRPDQRWTLRTLTSAINARPSNNVGLP